MTRQSKHLREFERLQKIAAGDSGLKDVIDFATKAVKLAGGGNSSSRIRMPYVNSPTMIERRWK